MKTRLIYIFSAFSFFLNLQNSYAVDIVCADGSCTIPQDIYDVVSGKDKAVSEFERAKVLYDMFGYPHELVKLSKTDKQAAAELESVVEDLRAASNKSNGFARMQLALIYYLQGDFESFRKYATPKSAYYMSKILDQFGQAFFDFDTMDNILSSNDYNSISSAVMDSLINTNKYDTAREFFESRKDNRFTCNSWQVVNMYCNIYTNNKTPEIREKFIKYLEENDISNSGSSKDAIIYALCSDDKAFAEKRDAAWKNLLKLPERRRWREIYNAENRLNTENKSAALEKLVEFGDCEDWEKISYINGLIFGNSNVYHNRLPKSVLKHPKFKNIIALLESIRDKNNNSTRVAYLLQIYKWQNNQSAYDKILNEYVSSFSRMNNWQIIETAKSFALGISPFPKDENIFMKLVANLTEDEKQDLFKQLSDSLISINNYYAVKRDLKEADKYLDLLLAGECFDALANKENFLSYGDMLATFDKHSKNRLARFMKGRYLDENSETDAALAEFLEAEKLGCGRVHGVLYGLRLTGQGLPKDKEKAEYHLDKFVKSIGDPCSTKKLNVYGAISIIKSKFGKSSEPYFGLLMKLREIPKFAYQANETLLFSPPMENREQIVKESLEYFKKDDSNRDNASVLYRYYSQIPYFNQELADRYYEIYTNNYNNKLEKVIDLFTGRRGEKDEEKAFKLIDEIKYDSNFRKILKAYCYQNGIGVEKNAETAAKFRNEVGVYSTDALYIAQQYLSFGPKEARDAEVNRYIEMMLSNIEYGDIDLRNKIYNLKRVARFYNRSDNAFADPAKSINLIERMIEEDSIHIFDLINIYANGKAKDDKKYFDSLCRAEELLKGNLTNRERVDLYLKLAFCHLNGRGTEKSPEKAYAFFEKASGKPYVYWVTVRAMEALAFCTERGIGVPADPAKAAKMRDDLRRTMLKNVSPINIDSAIAVANLYRYDGFLGMDRKLYEEWLLLAVENAPLQSHLESLYSLYTLNPKFRDFKKAAAAVEKYAKLWPDYPFPAYVFGNFKIFGIECEKDPEAGVELLKKAAKMGYPMAAERLSYIYSRGIGVEKNPAEAEKWLSNFQSMKKVSYRRVADSYIRGDYGVSDMERAKFIYALGAQNGNESCAETLDKFDEHAQNLLEKDKF